MRRLQVADVLGPEGLLRRLFPGFEARPGQLEMAEAVMRAFGGGGAVAIEAPTGIGKTLAYLVPAVLSGLRVVVSTNTKTLQEQIVDKDIPLLARVFREAGVSLVRATADRLPPEPTEVRYALMKGRSNYLCKERLDRKVRQGLLGLDASAPLLRRILEWSASTERGDRAEIAELEEDASVFDEIDARSETCLGQKCPRYEECFLIRMRREAENASIVVVNHHLLLADLTLRAQARIGGSSESRGGLGEIIPRGDVLIVDEAHALEDTASEYFGGEVSSGKVERFLKDALGVIAERRGSDALAIRASDAASLADAVFRALPIIEEGRVRIAPPEPPAVPAGESWIEPLEGVAEPLFASKDRVRLAGASPAGDGEPAGVFGGDAARRAGGSSRARGSRGGLGSGFGAARDKTRRAEAAFADLAEQLEALGDPGADMIARRARGIGEALRFVLDAADADFVYWAERGRRSARVGASPIEVAPLLSEHLFRVFEAVVLTSATLATGGGLGYFLERVGAPEGTAQHVLGTPFDYARQVALYVPPHLPEPDAPDALDAVCKTAHALIEQIGGGAFFLFTSHRAMNLAHEQLAARLSKRFPVLRQGEAPKRFLLADFIERSPAVLFATASFWEGVDVPGDPLRLVLIDRLPFASPVDPVVAARLERLERRGENAFHSYQVPSAILRLKQGFGRLVRRTTDRGVVAVLDPRIRTKGYGRRFLQALPEAELIEEPALLTEWLDRRGLLASEGSPKKTSA